jgi:hypothetical protein
MQCPKCKKEINIGIQVKNKEHEGSIQGGNTGIGVITIKI